MPEVRSRRGLEGKSESRSRERDLLSLEGLRLRASCGSGGVAMSKRDQAIGPRRGKAKLKRLPPTLAVDQSPPPYRAPCAHGFSGIPHDSTGICKACGQPTCVECERYICHLS